ncbi:MAG: hypothetical protein LAN71_07755 [Acidobacteriia bacterium]|nr:hypothetical protein [Terriglobia bacterium]
MRPSFAAASFFFLALLAEFVPCARAQNPAAPAEASPTGVLEFTARITPTAGRPEPVRQFTFYLLTRDYAEIVREADAASALPSREEFIDSLKVSPELKAWMKAHNTVNIATQEIELGLTAGEVISIPEFLGAYLQANSGITQGLPREKYKESDKTERPERYRKLRQEYLAALKKFIEANKQTLASISVYLEPINPGRLWNQLTVEHARKVARQAPEYAQTKYLAGKTDTDLDGRGIFVAIPAGAYWLSTLGQDAAAGDMRVRWNVPVAIAGGKVARIELSTLNASEARSSMP